MTHNTVVFLENYYENPPFNNNKCIVFDCSIGKCEIADIDERKFLILDGDEIKKCRNISGKNSCDRIIIKKDYQNETILFTEMSDTRKSLTKVTNQLKDSYEEISEVYEENSIKHSKNPKFLYLGRLKTHNSEKECAKKKIRTRMGPIKLLKKYRSENIKTFFK